jgi:NADH-quinone oxidoreductase subunit J
MTAEQVIFLIIAGMICGSAIMVVTARKLLHSALWLVAALFGIALIYALLEAGFMAVVQVVIYIGAIAILFIFAIMLTRKDLLDKGQQTRSHWWFPLVISLAILVGLFFIIQKFPATIQAASLIPEHVDTLRALGIALVSPEAFVLPFEVASILLLAALVGAVFIATSRKR